MIVAGHATRQPMGVRESGSVNQWLKLAEHGATGHTQPINGLLSGTIRVSRYQQGKTNFLLQQGAVASAGPCASLHLTPDRQPRQHPTTQVFTGWMPFLTSNQQRQSTKGQGKPDLEVILFCRTVVDAERCCVFHGVLREELRVDAPADGRREPPAQCHR